MGFFNKQERLQKKMYKVNSELNRCQDRLKDIKEGKSFGSLILIKNALGPIWIGPENVLLEKHIKN